MAARQHVYKYMHRWLATVLGTLTTVTTLPTFAAESGNLPPQSAGVDATLAGVEQRRPYWYRSGPIRPFFAATFEAGAIYLRPTAQLGYGRPHYRWLGIEVASAVSPSGVRMYGGIRGVFPQGSFRFGGRYEAPVNQDFLSPRDEYFTRDIEEEGLGLTSYLVLETEANAAVPFPGGYLFGVLAGYHIEGIPDGVFLFEEALRVVAKGPWLWRARLGYLYQVDFGATFQVGAAVEVIHLISRRSAVVRAGPVISVALTDHLSAVGATMLVVDSPDSLGLRGASFGELSLRYRWATGDWYPGFP